MEGFEAKFIGFGERNHNQAILIDSAIYYFRDVCL